MKNVRLFLLRVEEFCLIILIISLLAVVSVEVILRYSGFPLFWTEELARYLFVWIIMIGSIVGIERKLHFSVEFFIEYFPQGIRKFISVVGGILMIIFLLLLFYKGVQLCLSMNGVVSPSLGIPQYLSYLAIPVGGLLMFIHFGLQIYDKDEIK